MADLGKIKGNVSKMVQMNAPESDIDSYIQAEGVTLDDVKNYRYEGMQKQNAFGSIFNVPGAAIRSAVQAPFGQKIEAYKRGALYPDNVPRFQNVGLEKFYGATDPFIQKAETMFKPLGESLRRQRDLAGLGVSAVGLAGDIATNPADLLA